MKTLSIYKRCLLGSLTLLFTSCEKLVEVEDPTNQLNTQQVFSSTATAQSALSALYTEMQMSSLLSGGNFGAGALLGSYADDLDGYNINATNAATDLYNNIQTPSNTAVNAVWTNAYKEIYMANAIIAGIGRSVAIPASDAKRIKGEAMVLRSIIYFYLSQIFGDVPYTTVTDYAVNQSLTKTSADEVLDNISLDLVEAVTMLEDNYRNPERIFVNRKTAELSLALVYSRQGKWSDAEALLGRVVQSPMYTWQPDIARTFKKESGNIIFQLKPVIAGNATPEAMLYYFYSSDPRDYAASQDLISSFEPQDLRLQKWFEKVNSGQRTYYKINKYKTISQNNDECSVVFRLEEAYLLLAQAHAEQGKVLQSLAYLNPVRLKAGLPALQTNISVEDLKTEVLNESRREFFTERGIRFLHLKRSGKLEMLSIAKPNWKSFHALWPLPVSELSLNPNLNPQNNGY
ncbi:RagB/SusD family nutrient uptake outer membrane protein [Chryseobacterium sp. FH1]|uniref:RagB/SusD family nutrient uptake outer membrane protein n=1 Tax=Chryseobacterium sp. FH1 TaxID=1233951 RepID=UPI0004E3C2A0|nr:RagB/SusD family nutrient uptake outer membrane protein [Chryseobacterium sp. FH1]KFC19322.1 glycan metabolism protein RagB [Chryseobacterium sp. FH1]